MLRLFKIIIKVIKFITYEGSYCAKKISALTASEVETVEAGTDWLAEAWEAAGSMAGEEEVMEVADCGAAGEDGVFGAKYEDC